jgi:hypothetical protein
MTADSYGARSIKLRPYPLYTEHDERQHDVDHDHQLELKEMAENPAGCFVTVGCHHGNPNSHAIPKNHASMIVARISSWRR